MAANKIARLRNIRHKLQYLGCPYVDNVEESWLPELLFKPGEPRLRLIQWLLGRFDPSVKELLEGDQARISNLTDSRVGRPMSQKQRIPLMASQIASELEKQKKIVERLQANSSSRHELQKLERVSRTMSLTMSTLSQMVDGFTHCYETKIKPWSSREKPRLSDLGPVFKRVYLLLEKFLKVLTSLEKLKMSHAQILNVNSMGTETSLVPLGKVALSNLQECIGILDESLKRRTDLLNDTQSL